MHSHARTWLALGALCQLLGCTGGLTHTPASSPEPAADSGSARDASAANHSRTDAAIRVTDAATTPAPPKPDAQRPPSPDPGNTPDASGTADCTNMPPAVRVSSADQAGYPPYAQAGCQLLFVNPEGALRLRDLRSGVESTVAEATEQPVRPSLAGPAADPAAIAVWESLSERAVRVRYQGQVTSLRAAYDHTGQPRASVDAVVFSAWQGADDKSDSDIVLYTIATRAFSTVSSDPGQQLFADISATQIAYSDFAEDPDGRFDNDGQDLADIVLFERTTQRKTLHPLPGKQAFPLLCGNGRVAYLGWASSHPEPKLAAYKVVAWDPATGNEPLLADVQTLPPYIRPSTVGSTVEWVEQLSQGGARLMRVDDTGATPPQQAWAMSNVQSSATVSTPLATLMAIRGLNDAAPMLHAIPR